MQHHHSNDISYQNSRPGRQTDKLYKVNQYFIKKCHSHIVPYVWRSLCIRLIFQHLFFYLSPPIRLFLFCYFARIWASGMGSSVSQRCRGAKRWNVIERYSLGKLFVYSWTHHVTYGFNQNVMQGNGKFSSVSCVLHFLSSEINAVDFQAKLNCFARKMYNYLFEKSFSQFETLSLKHIVNFTENAID